MTPITDPTALADQVDAVLAEIRRVLHRAEHLADAHVSHAPATPWLASHIRALTTSILTGTAHACPHLAAGPRIIIAAIWRPGLIVCTDCISALTPDHTEDTTCDRCRQPGRTLTPHIAAIGPALLTYGLCQTCNTQHNPTQLPRPTSQPHPAGRPTQRRSRTKKGPR